MRQSNKSRWTGIGHKRKMEIKREERLKLKPVTDPHWRREICHLVSGSIAKWNRKETRKSFKAVYGRGACFRSMSARRDAE